jgi:predicted nucleotidyltransferase
VRDNASVNGSAIDLEHLKPVLAGARFAYVFGSYGTPAFGPESDVDIAVSFGHALAFDEKLTRRAALERAAGRPVDLVDLDAADPIIRMQVLKTGRPFLVTDSHAQHEFAMYALAAYFDWKLSRRPVEDAMRAAAAG